MADNKMNLYINAKVCTWWRDKEFDEYYAIIEINGQLRLIITKAEG